MSIKCCGTTWKTRFCGDCGKRLYHTPLEELRGHIEREVKSMKTRLGNNKSRSDTNYKKWSGWLAALDEVTKNKPTHRISACYFPKKREVELTWEDIETGESACLSTKVNKDVGEQIAKVVAPCVYQDAILKGSE